MRIPPQNLDAELSVLGCILLDQECIPDIDLKPEDFYRFQHGELYGVMLELYNSGEPVDLITLKDALEAKGMLESVGGIQFVSSLTDKVPTSASVQYHAKIVREKALLRKIILLGGEMSEGGYETVEPTAFLEDMEQKVLSIGDTTKESGFEKISQGMLEHVQRIESVSKEHSIPGVPTGFREIDRRTGGLYPGELTILAARPGVGKTTLALNILKNSAERGYPSAIVSLEMKAHLLKMRIICSECEVDSMNIKAGRADQEELKAYRQGAEKIGKLPILISDNPRTTVINLKSLARRIARRNGIKLLIVDYLSLLRLGEKKLNRYEEVSEISRELKILAESLNIPIIAASQLNREIEKERDHKPKLSHLRESGSIEQDADNVIFLYHPDPDNDLTVNGYLAKNRGGPIGEWEMDFIKKINRFEERTMG